jgi:hypothetical protein
MSKNLLKSDVLFCPASRAGGNNRTAAMNKVRGWYIGSDPLFPLQNKPFPFGNPV